MARYVTRPYNAVLSRNLSSMELVKQVLVQPAVHDTALSVVSAHSVVCMRWVYIHMSALTCG